MTQRRVGKMRSYDDCKKFSNNLTNRISVKINKKIGFLMSRDVVEVYGQD